MKQCKYCYQVCYVSEGNTLNLVLCYLCLRMDASLKELTNMVRVSNPEVRRRGTRFDFAVVYAEGRSQAYRMREIGSVMAGKGGPDDTATLASKKYQIGDLIDIAVTHPQRSNMRGMRSRPY